MFHDAQMIIENPKEDADIAARASLDANRACASYRVDVKAASFGACVCGFPKTAHGAIAGVSVKAAPNPSGSLKPLFECPSILVLTKYPQCYKFC
jgi:hypothetical protein